MAPQASNWRSKQSLPEWLEQNGVIGIHGVDTRALVRHLRELGPMNGVISSDGRPPLELLEDLKQAPSMEGLNLADQVTTPTAYRWTKSCSVAFDQRFQTRPERPYRVVAIDFGIKRAILDRLVSHGCDLTVLPANTDLDTVLSQEPEGVFLSNGPGDPAAVQSGITLAQRLLEHRQLPMFGICLGHQILGLALGGTTFKLAYGHRGLNHPCGSTGQVEITSQNHGFALDAGSLPEDKIEVTHFNLNDRTVAAFAHRNQPVFGVQYHPEASPGPHDADHHFARFTGLMADRR
jgi:carbamoyl-phosphate synthase small subunit